MASANLDLVRSIVADWERGLRLGRVGAPRDQVGAPRRSLTGPLDGRAGMADGTRDWLNAWEDIRVDVVDEYRELDDERVLVLVRYSGRGKRADWSSDK